MSDFINLLINILPLYALVAVGYFAGKRLGTDRNTIAPLLIYIISPVVVFYGVATAPINTGYLLLPLVFYSAAMVLSLLFYRIGKRLWKGSEKNLLSASAGAANTGYFGLPLALAISGESGLSIAVFCLMGSIMYEATRNYYIIARGQATAKEAASRTLKLPVIYTFIFGLLANRSGITFDGGLLQTFVYFKGAYVVFGMMMIGIVLASVKRGDFDLKFTSWAFVAKFVGFPLLVGSFVLLDRSILHLFSAQIYTIMMILSIVPMASNIITYATLLKTHPEKIALAVMASTLFALVYIPVFITLFLK